MRDIFTNSHYTITCYLLQNLFWMNNLFKVSFQLFWDVFLCSKTNYRCVQSAYISVDVAKCGQNFHKFTQYAHFLSVTKNDLSWLNNLFMVMFQLVRMSSYANNKLQMCSVNQHQCRRRRMLGKFAQIQPVHSHFDCYKNWLDLTEQSSHGN